MRVDHSSGFTIQVPNDWQVVEDPSPEIAVAALAPPDESGFSRNVTLTVGPLAPEWYDARAWQQAAVEKLLTALEDAQLIDVIIDDDGADDAFRQVITYVVDGRALVLEQWGRNWERSGTDESQRYGVTVSATTPVLQYPVHVDEMTQIAWSVYPTGEEQA